MIMIGPELDSYVPIGDEPLETLERIWQRAQSKRKELERAAEEEINKYVQGLNDTAEDATGTQTAQSESELVSPEKVAPSEDSETGT